MKLIQVSTHIKGIDYHAKPPQEFQTILLKEFIAIQGFVGNQSKRYLLIKVQAPIRIIRVSEVCKQSSSSSK